MKRGLLIAFAAVSASALASGPVYIMSSGNDAFDTQLMTSMQGYGLNVTLGARMADLTATTDLSGFRAVYAQYNYNWNSDSISVEAQQKLLDYVAGDNALVTNEWVMWRQPSLLLDIMPTTYQSFRSSASVTFTNASGSNDITSNLPNSFTFSPTNLSGTDSHLVAKTGATKFFSSDYASDAAGLAGWTAGGGRVFNFSTTMGENEIADANMSRLLAQTLTTAAVPEPGTIAALGLGALLLMRRRR